MKTYRISSEKSGIAIGKYKCISSPMSFPFINTVDEFSMSDDELCEWICNDVQYALEVYSTGPITFTAGDSVTAFGNIGTVKRITPNGEFIEVVFSETSNTVLFHLDGKYMTWHKRPSLEKL